MSPCFTKPPEIAQGYLVSRETKLRDREDRAESLFAQAEAKNKDAAGKLLQVQTEFRRKATSDQSRAAADAARAATEAANERIKYLDAIGAIAIDIREKDVIRRDSIDLSKLNGTYDPVIIEREHKKFREALDAAKTEESDIAFEERAQKIAIKYLGDNLGAYDLIKIKTLHFQAHGKSRGE